MLNSSIYLEMAVGLLLTLSILMPLRKFSRRRTARASAAVEKPTDAFDLAQALRRCRLAFAGVALFSGMINILMLTAPIFMLQVYDRVLPSHSVPTLIGLAILAVALFAFQGALDAIRGRVLLRIGASINEDLSHRVFDAIVRLPLRIRGGGDGLQPMRDLDQIRGFLSSPGPSALCDLPWIAFYVGVCYLFHPWIGIAALCGAAMLIVLTISTEIATSGPAKAATTYAAARNAWLDSSRRNAEVVQAMGMGPQLAERFEVANDVYLRNHSRATDRALMLGALSRVMRLALQSFVLGLGAYLVLNQEVTAGIIIASSILVSRALAPVDMAIANWKTFVAARLARKRLNDLFRLIQDSKPPLALPKPSGSLVVESASVNPPGNPRVVLQDIGFTLNSGDGLGVIGPSGCGKSSLARLMVGVWPPVRGKVRLDGAALDQWSPDLLGQHIGYLPQNVEVFEGTVAENISRFEKGAGAGAIIAAARAAGVHDLIVSLPKGYETDLGEDGVNLSAGQRQRIALSRALYRDPFLVVLDEPNSNLDSEGEEALSAAIQGVRARGGIVVVIAHRASALSAIDLLLVLKQGRQVAFGPKDQVLRAATRQPPAPLTVVNNS